jgi:hypothetical protein
MLEGGSLGSLSLEIGLDIERLQRDLANAEKMVADSLAGWNGKLAASQQRLGQRFLSGTITPRVDDRALTALNRHLDLKQQHWEEVRKDFAKPLTIVVDDSQLAKIKNIDIGKNSTLIINATALDKSLLRQEQILFKFLADLNRTQINVNARIGARSALTQGVGMAAGQDIYTGAKTALKKNFDFDPRKSVENVTSSVVFPVKAILSKTELKTGIDEFVGDFKKASLQIRYVLGNAILDAIDTPTQATSAPASILEKIKKGVDVFKGDKRMPGVGADFSLSVQNLRQLAFEQLVGEKGMGGWLGKHVGARMSNFRSKAIDDLAMPLVYQRAEEILKQNKSANSGATVDDSTKTLFVASGGYAAARGLSGKRMAQFIKQQAPADSKTIWIRNSATDLPDEALGNLDVRA